jgi:hypothetical protein
MAITSATPISFKTKEGASEPQQAFDITTKTPYITDENGNVTSWHYHHFVGDLHTKTLIVEGRGYHAGNLPPFGSNVVTRGWSITDGVGEVATEGSFYAKTVVVEGHRINEVGMWRVTKTVTIKVLYVNGVKATDRNGVVGVENFDEGDYKI